MPRETLPAPRPRQPSNPRGLDNPEAVYEQQRADRERVLRLAAEQERAELEERIAKLEAALHERPKVEIETAPTSSATRDQEFGRAMRVVLKQIGAMVLAAALGGAGSFVATMRELARDRAAQQERERVKADTDRAQGERLGKIGELEAARQKYERAWQDYQIDVWNKSGIVVPRPENAPAPEPVDAKPLRRLPPPSLIVETKPPAPPSP